MGTLPHGACFAMTQCLHGGLTTYRLRQHVVLLAVCRVVVSCTAVCVIPNKACPPDVVAEQRGAFEDQGRTGALPVREELGVVATGEWQR